MPELPEVETVVRSIAPKIIGKRINSIHVFWDKTLATHSQNSINKSLPFLTYVLCYSTFNLTIKSPILLVFLLSCPIPLAIICSSLKPDGIVIFAFLFTYIIHLPLQL